MAVASDQSAAIRMRIGAPRTRTRAVLAAMQLDPAEAERCTIHVLEVPYGRSARLMEAGVTASASRLAGRLEVTVRVPWDGPEGLRSDMTDQITEAELMWELVREWDGAHESAVAKLSCPRRVGHGVAAIAYADPPLWTLFCESQLTLLARVMGTTAWTVRLAVIGWLQEYRWTVRHAHLDLGVRWWREEGDVVVTPAAGRRLGEALFDAVEFEATVDPDDAAFLYPVMRSAARLCGFDPELGLGPIEMRAAVHLVERWAGTGSPRRR
jgi:hypothetical protein